MISTMWDEVDPQMAAQREVELKQRYWKGMISQGSTALRHDGSRNSAWDILDHFLQSHRLFAVLLQQEMVDFKRNLPETKAGSELYGTLEVLVKRQHAILLQLEKEKKLHSDEQVVQILQEEFEAQRQKLQSTVREMQSLHLPLGKRIVRLLTSPLRIP
jgi:hypothetical protein